LPAFQEARIGGTGRAPVAQFDVDTGNKNSGGIQPSPPRRSATMGNYLGRVVRSDSFRKGIAAAVAGTVISAFVEAVWPSSTGS